MDARGTAGFGFEMDFTSPARDVKEMFVNIRS